MAAPGQTTTHNLGHILSPETEYSGGSTQLYEQIETHTLQELASIVPNDLRITLTPVAIEAFPPAVIIKWRDDGTYAALRKTFTEAFSLPAGTRQPPAIIHTTIARFQQELPMKIVQQAVASLHLPATQEVTKELQIVHEQKIFMREHCVLASFPSHQK